MADRGLKFEQVSVRFCAVSNIFNFDIRHMTASEVHAHAINQASNVPELEGPELEGPESADGEPTQVVSTSSPGPNCDKADFDVSQVPVLDDSAISSGSSTAESRASNFPAGSTSQSRLSRGLPQHDSGSLIFLIRALFLYNFFISSSFFIFLS